MKNRASAKAPPPQNLQFSASQLERTNSCLIYLPVTDGPSGTESALQICAWGRRGGGAGCPRLGELLWKEQERTTGVHWTWTLSFNTQWPFPLQMWATKCLGLWPTRLTVSPPLGKTEGFPFQQMRTWKSRAGILKQKIHRRISDIELDFQGNISIYFFLIL